VTTAVVALVAAYAMHEGINAVRTLAAHRYDEDAGELSMSEQLLDSCTIAGGGRYDRMVGRLLGHDVPACGFSIGFERVVSILGERDGGPGAERDRIAFLFDRDDPLSDVVASASRLRQGERVVSLTLKRKNLAKQLDDLAGEGFGSYAVLRPGPDAPEIKPLARRASSGDRADG